MVNRNRKVIKQLGESTEIEHQTIADALTILIGLAKKYGYDAVLDYDEFDSEDRSLYVFSVTPESDVEMQLRINQEENFEESVNQLRDESERKEYERLSIKFGGQILG